METNYLVIHLANGLLLVGDVTYAPNEFIIRNPLQLIAREARDANGKIIGESINFKPYITMSDDTKIVIERQHVITTVNLGQGFVRNYEVVARQAFAKEMDIMEDVTDEELEAIEREVNEMDKEQLEYYERLLSELLTDNKTIH